MKDFAKVSRLVAPELISTLEERYLLLRHISHAQPIGRRLLAEMVQMSERTVRTQIELLKDYGLVDFSSQGTSLTPLGKKILEDLSEVLSAFSRTKELENKICKKLGIEMVRIVEDHSSLIARQHNLGLEASKILLPYVTENSILAVSGGSTLAAMAEAFPVKNVNPVVIPARGGFGERVEHQANVIASVLAEKTSGTYHMLHIPDGLSPEALNMLVKMEPQVKRIIDLSAKVDVLVFGIGQAIKMAEQRHLPIQEQKRLEELGAIGEALGHYCGLEGDIVHATNNVGTSFSDISTIPCVMAIAGGKEKAKAIVSVMRACKKGILVTDEDAALEMKNLLCI